MNVKTLLATAILTLLFSAARVYAQVEVYGEGEKRNGMGLVADCNGNELARIACAEYVKGVSDGFTIATVVLKQKNPVCIPHGVSADQMVKVVIKYADDHPAELHLSSSMIVLTAIHEAFPCGK
jgi:Rap1a immunity proteins